MEITTEEEPDTEDTEEFTIPTYTDGETEYEFPAANVDDTEIPEITLDDVKSDDNLSAKKDKKTISVKPVYTTEKKNFFVNEGKVNPSKIKTSSNTVHNEDLLIENYDETLDADVLKVMRKEAMF